MEQRGDALVLPEILHHEGRFQTPLVVLERKRIHLLAAAVERDHSLGRDAPGGHRQVRALAVHRIHELPGIADDDPAIAGQPGDRLVAAFGDQVGG